MVSKPDEQTFTSEFDFYEVSHSYGFVPLLSKKLSELTNHLNNFHDEMPMFFYKRAKAKATDTKPSVVIKKMLGICVLAYFWKF